MFVLCCCNYRWKLSVHQKSAFSGDRILKRSVPGKKASKAGRSDCLFDFFIRNRNSGDSNRIFSDVFFAYNAKEIQHR